ncbi:hypothetical protein FPQ18DRAFT_418042 [Pyronema domesticum]|nr:hypothetical protein FPQ18DRAFT_418042 [Pyronema domesticum]
MDKRPMPSLGPPMKTTGKSFEAFSQHKRWQSIELNVAPSPNSAQYHSDIPDVPSLPAGAHASSTALTSEFNDLSISSMANGDGSPQLGGISSTRGYFDVDETASDYVPTYTTPPKGGMLETRSSVHSVSAKPVAFKAPLWARKRYHAERRFLMTTIKEEEEEEEPAPTKPAGDSYISARQRYQETGESMSKSATMGYISPITRKPLVPKVPRSPTAAPTFNIPRKSVPGSPVLASCSVSAAEFTATVEAVVAGPSSAVSAATHLAIPAMPQGFTHRGRMVNYASIDTALVKSGGLDGYEDAEEGDEEAQDADDDSDKNDDNEASLAFQA